MLPPGYMDQQEKQKKPEEEKKKTDNQCLQTLICMLSCKEGYELGQKGGDGCQTCKCVKKGKHRKHHNQTCKCVKKKKVNIVNITIRPVNVSKK